MIAAVVAAAVVAHPVVVMAEVASVKAQCPVEALVAIMIVAAMAEVGTAVATAEIGIVAASTMIAMAALGNALTVDGNSFFVKYWRLDVPNLTGLHLLFHPGYFIKK